MEMTLPEYTEILREIEEQAPWRTNADKEMDYVDGNQLDSELLQRQQAVGIPPAIEDLMGPAIRALTGRGKGPTPCPLPPSPHPRLPGAGRRRRTRYRRDSASRPA